MKQKVFATFNLNYKKYLSLIKKGYSKIIYINKEEFTNASNIELINSNQFRTESTWNTWERNDKILYEFISKFNQLRFYKNINLYPTFQKLLFWSNHKTGYLYYPSEKLFNNLNVDFDTELYKVSKLKTLLKYFIFRLKNVKLIFKETRFNASESELKMGLFIKSKFELQNYKYLVESNKFCIFTNQIEIYSNLKKNNFIVHFIPQENKLKFLKINIFQLKKHDWYILNQILIKWNEISLWYKTSETIAKSGINKLIINEGENGIFGSIIGEFMKQNNIETFNTMNGAKCGEVQDSYISFDKWFIWDEKMKELLHHKNHINNEKLIVCGHLSFDEIINYKYQDSFIDYKQIKEDKIIVSLFSVRGLITEKIEVFNFLKEELKRNSNIVIVLRYHPSENKNDQIFFENSEDKVIVNKFNKENSKKTLLDQLIISDLSICFGSTVGLESKWLGVPCITYEQRKESMIYACDDKNIIHVKNLDEFKANFYKLLKKKTKTKIELNSTSKRIIEYLEN